jgi:hypothetical protein
MPLRRGRAVAPEQLARQPYRAEPRQPALPAWWMGAAETSRIRHSAVAATMPDADQHADGVLSPPVVACDHSPMTSRRVATATVIIR